MGNLKNNYVKLPEVIEKWGLWSNVDAFGKYMGCISLVVW